MAKRVQDAEYRLHDFEAYERRLITRRYDSMVLNRQLPRIHAWIRLDPDKRWTVYIGSQYSPRSNTRRSFDRGHLDDAHSFARREVVRKMRKAMQVWDRMHQ